MEFPPRNIEEHRLPAVPPEVRPKEKEEVERGGHPLVIPEPSPYPRGMNLLITGVDVPVVVLHVIHDFRLFFQRISGHGLILLGIYEIE